MIRVLCLQREMVSKIYKHLYNIFLDQANLTAQFGARPAINDETFLDDNTQALFAPAQQTCTEAFFEQIHEHGGEPMVVDNARPTSVQNLTVHLKTF